MNIKIYQIPYNKDKRDLLFMNYKFTMEHGGVAPDEYECVFDGDVGTHDLEKIYRIFNSYEGMPEGFIGRSLSVSDVVVTEGGAFFCDSVGFVPLVGMTFGDKDETSGIE